jgi:hypothetical protein
MFGLTYLTDQQQMQISLVLVLLLDLQQIFVKICALDVNDGLLFQADSVHAAEIRKDANYEGVRVTMMCILDGAKCKLQVDVGFGDAVTLAPESVEYPVTFPQFESPKLRVYPRYTVIAEKFQALTALGIANSRMKDYFDLWILSQHANFDGEILQQAIKATFQRRSSSLPEQTPYGLTQEFAMDTQKQTQWRAFIRKSKLDAPSLDGVILILIDFLMPTIIAKTSNTVFKSRWDAGGPWLRKNEQQP